MREWMRHNWGQLMYLTFFVAVTAYVLCELPAMMAHAQKPLPACVCESTGPIGTTMALSCKPLPCQLLGQVLKLGIRELEGGK
jgi:hypothetical protein